MNNLLIIDCRDIDCSNYEFAYYKNILFSGIRSWEKELISMRGYYEFYINGEFICSNLINNNDKYEADNYYSLDEFLKRIKLRIFGD